MLGTDVDWIFECPKEDLPNHSLFITENHLEITKILGFKMKNNEFNNEILQVLAKTNLNSHVLSLVSVLLQNSEIKVKVEGLRISRFVRQKTKKYDDLLFEICSNFLFYRDILLLEKTIPFLLEFEDNHEQVLELLMKQFVYTIDNTTSILYLRSILKISTNLGVLLFKFMGILTDLVLELMNNMDEQVTLLAMDLMLLLNDVCFVRYKLLYPKILARLAERYKFEENEKIISKLQEMFLIIKEDESMQNDFNALQTVSPFDSLWESQ